MAGGGVGVWVVRVGVGHYFACPTGFSSFSDVFSFLPQNKVGGAKPPGPSRLKVHLSHTIYIKLT